MGGQKTTQSYAINDREIILAALSLEIVKPLVQGNDSTYLVRATTPTCSVEQGTLLVAKFIPCGAGVSTDFIEHNNTSIKGLVAPLYQASLGIAGRLVIFKYYPTGSLRDYMKQGRLSDNQIRTVVEQVTNVLMKVDASVPGKYFVHGDIKPENILIETISPLNVLLTDFDHSMCFDSMQSQPHSGMLSLGYAAPETFGGVFNHKSDYWSLGMLALELLRGKHPFARLDDLRIRELIATTWEGRSAGLSSDIEEKWCALLYGLLYRLPEQRWDSSNVILWLANDIKVIAEGLGLGHEPSATQALTFFTGNTIFTKRALARTMISQWEQGISALHDARLSEWLNKNLQDQTLTSRLNDVLQDTNINDDERLVRFAYFAHPEMAPCWRGVLLRAGTLQDIARQALENGNHNSFNQLVLLRDNAIRIAQSFRCLGIRDPEQLIGNWPNAWQRYQDGFQRLVTAGAPDERPDEQAALPALILLWLSEEARQQLIREIVERSDAIHYLLRRDWYFALGHNLCDLPLEHQWILKSLDESSLVDSLMYSMEHRHMASMHFSRPPEITDEQLSQSVLYSRTTARLTRKLFPQLDSRLVGTLNGEEHHDHRLVITEDDSFIARLTAPVGQMIRNVVQITWEWLKRRFRMEQAPQNQATAPTPLTISAVRINLALTPYQIDDRSIQGQAVLIRWDLPAGVHPAIHIGHPGLLGIRVSRQRIVRLPFRRRENSGINALERLIRGNDSTRLPHRGQIILAFFQPTVVWLRFRTPNQRWSSTRSQALRLGAPEIKLRKAEKEFIPAGKIMQISPRFCEAQNIIIRQPSKFIPSKFELHKLRNPLIDELSPALSVIYKLIKNRRVRLLMAAYTRLIARGDSSTE